MLIKDLLYLLLQFFRLKSLNQVHLNVGLVNLDDVLYTSLRRKKWSSLLYCMFLQHRVYAFFRNIKKIPLKDSL